MLEMTLNESENIVIIAIQSNVVSYIKYVVGNYSSLAESKNVQLIAYSESDEIIMDFDPESLYEVVANLIVYAIKIVPENGDVVLHVKRDNKNNTLIIKISVTGTDRMGEKQSEPFDHYYQGEYASFPQRVGARTRMGYLKDLLELMDGTISTKNKQCKGSLFVIRIPISNNAELFDHIHKSVDFKPSVKISRRAENNEHIYTNDKTNFNKKLVMIVEDNPASARSIISYVDKQFSTVYARNAKEGIEKAIELTPDLIISDMMIPKRDGFDLCQTLKIDRRTCHIPIILLTNDLEKDKLADLKSGADAYLTKPFSKEELLIRIKRMLDLREQLLRKYSVPNQISTKPKNYLHEDFMIKVVNYIYGELSNENLNNSSLANAMNLSTSQLFRKLKAQTGMSTSLFIRYLRLHKARELINNSDMNISTIAYETGFKDPAWFSKAFKKEFGCAPIEIRHS